MRSLGWALGALGLLATAHAFTTTRGDRTRWAQPPTWAVGRATPDVPLDRLNALLDRAFDPWRRVAGVEMPLPRVAVSGALRVDFLDPWPPELGAAVTGSTVTTTEGATYLRAEILLNDVDLTFTDDPEDGASYVPGVLTHEIGHALGLGHSPRRDATMYWHYQGAAGETLDADDERGLRFLYGAPAWGEACDTCVVTDDCAPGAWCLAAEQGFAYCGAPCDGGCPAGFDCVGLQNGAQACWPRAGQCSDRAFGTAQRGDPCWGANHCGGGLRCAVLPGGAFCAADCRGDFDCFVGERCLVGWGGVARACVPVDGAPLGARCAVDLDCAEGRCLGAPEDRRCRRTCADDGACGDGRCAPLQSALGLVDGCTDPTPDAGASSPDAAPPADAAAPIARDAGPSHDAGAPDAETPDDDGALPARDAARPDGPSGRADAGPRADAGRPADDPQPACPRRRQRARAGRAPRRRRRRLPRDPRRRARRRPADVADLLRARPRPKAPPRRPHRGGRPAWGRGAPDTRFAHRGMNEHSGR
ncbi:MAG: matrixin family metalloprotease [Myxococcales bacterium]|nr:matrixin family metalloprotease [Myxococcales bacterium]